jgi:hypothetical protein
MKSIVLILMEQLDIDMQRLENMNEGEGKRGDKVNAHMR